MSKPRLYRQGVSIYVIGTGDIQEACRIAGITPETHQWSGTSYGHVVRRKNGWQFRDPAYLPKDARPAVGFIGPIRARDSEGAISINGSPRLKPGDFSGSLR